MDTPRTARPADIHVTFPCSRITVTGADLLAMPVLATLYVEESCLIQEMAQWRQSEPSRVHRRRYAEWVSRGRTLLQSSEHLTRLACSHYSG